MHPTRTALVLSGGGARGAYEAGAVAGLIEVLGPHEQSPFDRFAGTSVGAINATYLASHAHRPDLGVEQLTRLWTGIRLKTHLRLARRVVSQRALLDVRAFEEVIRDQIDWRMLGRNVQDGRVAALFIAALHVDSGHTTVFADLAPGTPYPPSANPQRQAVTERITPAHVLASAAIPGVFPPRRVGSGLFYDGGLRFNTPMAPTIRSGARKLVVVSPLYSGPRIHNPVLGVEHLPDAYFLAGKMLHAVLLDPFAYDLQVLHRFNDLLESLDGFLDPQQRATFDARVTELRGAPYHTLKVLGLSPSRDIGECALEFLSRHRRSLLKEGALGAAIALATPRLIRSGTDLVSYILFDGRFTAQLVEMGRRDVLDRADEVRAFFAAEPEAI